MKKLSLLVLVLLASNSYAADAYNGKEYKMRQSLQNLNITGTGNNSIDINGGGDIDGQLTINSTVTITGNAFSVGGSTLVVSGGKVGVGISPTLGTFQIVGTNVAILGAEGILNVISNDAAAINKGGSITFGATSDVANRATATIGGRKEAAGTDFSSYLNFETRSNAGTMVEKMRITSTGNVGIGTTAPGTKLHVSSGVFTLDGTNSYFNIAVSSTITTATDPCTIGDLRRDADYFYLCTAANTWKRSAFATWP